MIKEKLESFGGARSGLDDDTKAIIGKLLIEKQDEKLDADTESYIKLYRLTGGFLIIVLLVCATIFFQYFDLYSASIS